jgi:hypothetical protein
VALYGYLYVTTFVIPVPGGSRNPTKLVMGTPTTYTLEAQYEFVAPSTLLNTKQTCPDVVGVKLNVMDVVPAPDTYVPFTPFVHAMVFPVNVYAVTYGATVKVAFTE